MKTLKNNIVFILFLACITGCNMYGEKLQYNKTELYYTEKASKEDAEKLGEFLVRTEFADDTPKSIQLSKTEDGNYLFRMVVKKDFAEKESYHTILQFYAQQLSDSVFNGKPVDVDVCDDTFETLKHLPFKKE